MSTMTMPAGQERPSIALSGQQNGHCPDDQGFEIVNGERVELPPMSIFAVAINACLHLHLGSFVAARKLGRVVLEAKFILDGPRKFQRQPDLAFVSAQTWPLNKPLPRTGDWQVVPDLTVEVVSPNDLFEDVLAKIIEYFAFGVKLAWLVSPLSAKVFVFESPHKVTLLSAADELAGGDVVPGFRLKLGDLFENTSAN